jgi:hypothetical protein
MFDVFLGIITICAIIGGLYLLWLAVTYSFWSFLGVVALGFVAFVIGVASSAPRF